MLFLFILDVEVDADLVHVLYLYFDDNLFMSLGKSTKDLMEGPSRASGLW